MVRRLTNKSEKLANIGEQMGIDPLNALDNLISLISDYHKKDNIDYHLIRQKLLKLKELEEIEQLLGLDIKTLFKALNNPVYIKEDIFEQEVNKTEWCSNRLIGGLELGSFLFMVDETCVYTCDYGTTWALTKEELL